eukprot:2221913-Rhodomonas_salina.3
MVFETVDDMADCLHAIQQDSEATFPLVSDACSRCDARGSDSACSLPGRRRASQEPHACRTQLCQQCRIQ